MVITSFEMNILSVGFEVLVEMITKSSTSYDITLCSHLKVSCLAQSSTLNMEAISQKTEFFVRRVVRPCIPTQQL
jgi:hypothetical protein